MELKACPFDNGEAEFHHDGSHLQIRCKSCFAKSWREATDHRLSMAEATHKLAIGWNTRASDAVEYYTPWGMMVA